MLLHGRDGGMLSRVAELKEHECFGVISSNAASKMSEDTAKLIIP